MSARNTVITATPQCVTHSDVYQNPLLEDSQPTTAADRRTQQQLTARATLLCRACPLQAECLYRAVVQCDVAGVAGGTTPRQRQQIRHQLGVHVAPENLDSMVGTTLGHRQLTSDEVARLRASNPTESLETLAARLGCSLSTVKRHLRRHRDSDDAGRAQLTVVSPSRDHVMAAYHAVVAPAGASRRTAA